MKLSEVCHILFIYLRIVCRNWWNSIFSCCYTKLLVRKLKVFLDIIPEKQYRHPVSWPCVGLVWITTLQLNNSSLDRKVKNPKPKKKNRNEFSFYSCAFGWQESWDYEFFPSFLPITLISNKVQTTVVDTLPSLTWMKRYILACCFYFACSYFSHLLSFLALFPPKHQERRKNQLHLDQV